MIIWCVCVLRRRVCVFERLSLSLPLSLSHLFLFLFLFSLSLSFSLSPSLFLSIFLSPFPLSVFLSYFLSRTRVGTFSIQTHTHTNTLSHNTDTEQVSTPKRMTQRMKLHKVKERLIKDLKKIDRVGVAEVGLEGDPLSGNCLFNAKALEGRRCGA
jgi:hypothetical protein